MAGNPVVTGTTISSTWANDTLSDIATGLTTCVLKDGTQATTASVPFVFGIAVTTAMTTPSTTFALVNTTVTTLNFAGGATTLNVGAAASDTTWTGQSFTLTGANSTDNTVLAVTNTSNAAAASHSYVDISVGGTTSTGDPHTRWTIPSGTSWYAGVDNSDSDSWKLGTGTAVGTNTVVTANASGINTAIGQTTPAAGSFTTLIATGNVTLGDNVADTLTMTTNAMSVTAAGEVTHVLQPAFAASNSVTDTNVTGTGSGSAYTVVFNVEIFDQNADYDSATGIFTAPVTGRYTFQAGVYVTGNIVATAVNMNLVTSNRTWLLDVQQRAASADDFFAKGSVTVDMDAGDTAYVSIYTSGEAGNTADVFGSAGPNTYFSGFLAC